MGEPDARSAPFRPPAPEPAAVVRWPESFGTRFVVTVDTEEEFDWSAPLAREARSVTAIAALPDAHRRFAERGVPLCYLVDHPVASDPGAVDTMARLLEDGRSTLGAQLHPWVTPPFDEALTGANSFPGNLPRTLEAAKIDALTGLIGRAFGREPLVYRSGRYGIGRDTLALLAERGYRIDSSVRARYDYSDHGGPDFSALGSDAWQVAGLIEMPLTTVFTGRMRRKGAALYPALGAVPKGRGAFARLGLLSRVALTPEDMPVREAQEAVRVALDEGERLLVFSFHSPSLMPGNTPYVRDAADLARFHDWWRQLLDLLAQRGVGPASTDEVIAAAEAAR